MLKITVEQLNQCWNKMFDFTMVDVTKVINALGRRQPYVLAYLQQIGDDILNIEERKRLIFMGMFIWRVTSKDHSKMRRITFKLIDEKEAANIALLKYLNGEPQSNFLPTAQKILLKYHQIELLSFIVDRLRDDGPNTIDIPREKILIMLIFLKTIIDCMISITQDNC
jgi:hypothetical protein